MKKIIKIEKNWDCPHFIDGFHKVDCSLPRFGCAITKKICSEEICPLPDLDEKIYNSVVSQKKKHTTQIINYSRLILSLLSLGILAYFGYLIIFY